MLSNLSLGNLRGTQHLMIALALLTTIFCGNVLRFSPANIDRTYDTTSEGFVLGRLARSAADGLRSENADLGMNFDAKHPTDGLDGYNEQKAYFEDPSLIRRLDLSWSSYISHFGLQGIAFSIADLINPLPRKLRLGFYHLLASLLCAGALVWIAEIMRRRFGWAAFYGFLIPPTIEPMFTALAPNLYWVVGIWFVPMAIAIHLADEENSRRRFWLIAAAFFFFLVKALCGYEFMTTVILAAAVGCLLGIKESTTTLSRIFGNIAWIVSAGIAGFVVAVLAHATKQGGFAIILERAARRVRGDSPSLNDELIMGKFASVGSVILRYLDSNYITLIKNYGVVLGLLVLVAVVALIDRKIIWYLGDNRRKLHICALAFLASLAAPLSWFVLAKAHSFAHPAINFILWYLPTIPLGGALVGVSLNQAIENRPLWRINIARSALTASIPAAIIVAIAGIYFIDRRIQTQGTWVIPIHAKGIPLFEGGAFGLQFRMTDNWFTVQADCSITASADSFAIRAHDGDRLTNYDFKFSEKQVLVNRFKCLYAQARADRPISRINFGVMSNRAMLWEREELISVPDSVKPEKLPLKPAD